MKQTLTVWSPQLRNHRPIDVYLPAGYDGSRRRYPVIYFQDGQNLSDPRQAFAGTWELEGALRQLSAVGLDAIVIGVHNAGERRLAEYSPFADPRHGGGNADRYLRFLIDTIKPRIDTRYRTRPDRRGTAIVGSSMGGLVSLYAFYAAPRLFGAAGAMSPAIWFGGRRLLDDIASRPAPRGRIYLDVGTDEGDEALRDARALARLLRVKKGVQARRTFRYVEAVGHQHREPDWARRLPEALMFLLGAFD